MSRMLPKTKPGSSESSSSNSLDWCANCNGDQLLDFERLDYEAKVAEEEAEAEASGSSNFSQQQVRETPYCSLTSRAAYLSDHLLPDQARATCQRPREPGTTSWTKNSHLSHKPLHLPSNHLDWKRPQWLTTSNFNFNHNDNENGNDFDKSNHLSQLDLLRPQASASNWLDLLAKRSACSTGPQFSQLAPSFQLSHSSRSNYDNNNNNNSNWTQQQERMELQGRPLNWPFAASSKIAHNWSQRCLSSMSAPLILPSIAARSAPPEVEQEQVEAQVEPTSWSSTAFDGLQAEQSDSAKLRSSSWRLGSNLASNAEGPQMHHQPAKTIGDEESRAALSFGLEAASLWAPNHHYHLALSEPQRQPHPLGKRQDQRLSQVHNIFGPFESQAGMPFAALDPLSSPIFQPQQQQRWLPADQQRDTWRPLEPHLSSYYSLSASLPSSPKLAQHDKWASCWPQAATTTASSPQPHHGFTSPGQQRRHRSRQRRQPCARLDFSPTTFSGWEASRSATNRAHFRRGQEQQEEDEDQELSDDGLSLIPIEARAKMPTQVAEQMKAQASNFVSQYKELDGRKRAHFNSNEEPHSNEQPTNKTSLSPKSGSGSRQGRAKGPELRVRRTLRVKIKKRKPILGIAIEGGFNVSGQLLPRIVCVHEDGAAYQCGKLRASDLILEVNGISTVNMSHEQIAETIATAYYHNQRNYIEFLIGETAPV